MGCLPLAPARSRGLRHGVGGFLVTLWLMTTLLLVTLGPYQPAQNWVSLPRAGRRCGGRLEGNQRRCGKPGEGREQSLGLESVMMAELEKGRVEPSPARLSLQARRQKLQAGLGHSGPWAAPDFLPSWPWEKQVACGQQMRPHLCPLGIVPLVDGHGRGLKEARTRPAEASCTRMW